ncbi:NADP-dependent oxidoreductase domain-containing protein [Hygrophoropsis aurantiaca]|uniref:NADP-dependent oxidoreductase domain-containing protein n=1 Tax=Hygrophoropsis aurantiaca TaxID=72124 RepID=A0ACB8AW06_9AGAM|nr:NADP-dependent oxidoreductase domain-containing protein [Hygrophoropsis aurantiaca]
MSTRIPLLFGTPGFGAASAAGSVAARINTVKDAQDVVNLFTSYGHKGIDTSRCYGNGSSEEFIGQLDLHGGYVDTGYGVNFPLGDTASRSYPSTPGEFAPEKLRESVRLSVEALGKHKIHTFFLHAPDRSIPIEDTLRTINELYKEGNFEEFGVSNYNSWEVAEIVAITKENNWIKPTVYQGLYNAVERRIEVELLPCLRHFGIRYDAYSPLASGLLTGKFLSDADMQSAKGTRWDPNASQFASALQEKYSVLIPLVRELAEVLKKYDIRVSEAAQRWLQHHSELKPELGDAIIIGASSITQLEANLKDCMGGPLPEEVLNVLNRAWEKARGVAPHYTFI